MATTNYSLPTLESTALFDLVTDYNALSNATDSALASVAGLIPTESITEMEGQISALQTLTGSQGTQITTLQSQVSTANGNISTLQSGLETANGNIGQLQTGLQTANQNIANNTNELSAIKTDFNDYSTFTTTENRGANIFTGANSNSSLYLMKNTSETIIKLFGSFGTEGSVNRSTVPNTSFNNGNQVYGIKTNIKAINKSLSKGYLIQFVGVSQSTRGGDYNGSVSYAIGSDGYVYLAPSANNEVATAIGGNYLMQIPIFIGSPINYSEMSNA